ncbi:MAG TPA: hypothetical protein VLF94_07165 [Chlamydiales bacterium]|nr:hypothetical protein [Chlamydiales bacterium]
MNIGMMVLLSAAVTLPQGANNSSIASGFTAVVERVKAVGLSLMAEAPQAVELPEGAAVAQAERTEEAKLVDNSEAVEAPKVVKRRDVVRKTNVVEFYVTDRPSVFDRSQIAEDEGVQDEALILRGLILVSSKENMLLKNELKPFEGVQMQGCDIPVSQEELASCLNVYMGSYIDSEVIFEIKSLIKRHCIKNDIPFVSIYIPRQKISYGILQIVVSQDKESD